MITINSFNLAGRFRLDCFEDEIRWCKAQEWHGDNKFFPYLGEGETVTFTDYIQGKSKVIEDALLIERADDIVSDKDNSRRFQWELQQVQPWTHTKYVIIKDDPAHFLEVYFTKQFNQVPAAEAREVLTRVLGVDFSEIKPSEEVNKYEEN